MQAADTVSEIDDLPGITAAHRGVIAGTGIALAFGERIRMAIGNKSQSAGARREYPSADGVTPITG
jgi:hypothetical protein